MIYAGLDLHKSFSVITMMNAQGKEMIKQKKLPNNGEIIGLFQGFDDQVTVAMEATCSWYWLYDLLEENGIEVKLSHPLKTKAIASAKVKNDKIDSKVLAHLLRADLLPLSYVPKRDIRMQRELLRYRASLVRIQTGIKNRVHAILAKNNITHDFSDLFGKQGKDFLVSLSLLEVYRSALDGYLSVLDELSQQIKVVNKRIVVSAKNDEDVKLLVTIPGVGDYSALLIKSEIGDINRFPSTKQLCSYAGLIPSTYSSGNAIFHGHITKQGSKWLRWILAEAIGHCVTKSEHFQQFYWRLERRKGEKIAKVATERKLLEWIYHMLKERRIFQDMERIANTWGEPASVTGLR
jgi:transposase